jgi:predicted RNA-binding Zn ribbon-like protein
VDDADKRRIGEQLEPGGRPKAPGRLELLQRFVNTHNHDFPEDWDRLGTAAKATAWLREKGLIAAGARVSAAEAARLRELREALRALIVAGHDGLLDPAAIATIAAAAHDGALTVAVDPEGRTSLAPGARGAAGAAAVLLGILHEAQLTGDWDRMKGCRQCEYAFYDRSKNRSAAWCAMSICGNRTKNRAYYRRRRGAA